MREIQDNSIVSHEIIHHVDSFKGKNYFIAIKIDMEKPFNRVERPLLLQIMKDLWFMDNWYNGYSNISP